MGDSKSQYTVFSPKIAKPKYSLVLEGVELNASFQDRVTKAQYDAVFDKTKYRSYVGVSYPKLHSKFKFRNNFAWIGFNSLEDAVKAQADLNGKMHFGRRIRIAHDTYSSDHQLMTDVLENYKAEARKKEEARKKSVEEALKRKASQQPAGTSRSSGKRYRRWN